MKTAILYSVWTSFLASRLPCPISMYSFSKDHVLPKSLFPRVIVEDPQNIIPLPTKINNSRGNRPYTNKWRDGYMVYGCNGCPNAGFCQGAGVMTEKGMMPPKPFKGPIARSVLKMIEKYPKFAEKINDEVLDYNVAREWDRMYPMTVQEHDYRSNSS